MLSTDLNLYYLATSAIDSCMTGISSSLKTLRSTHPVDNEAINDLKRASFDLFMCRSSLSVRNREGLLAAIRAHTKDPARTEEVIEELMSEYHLGCFK